MSDGDRSVPSGSGKDQPQEPKQPSQALIIPPSSALIPYQPRITIEQILRAAEFQRMLQLVSEVRCLLAQFSWIQLKYLYRSGQPVPNAKWVLLRNDVPFLDGPLDEIGFVRRIVPREGTYCFYCHQDPTPFKLFGHQTIKTDALNRNPKQWGDLVSRFEWIQGAFDGAEFPPNASLEQLTLHVVRESRLVSASVQDITEAIVREQSETALLLRNLLAGDQGDDILFPLVFTRLTACCGAAGSVVQRLLVLLNAGDYEVWRVVHVLNSVGEGNAVDWLRTLDTLLSVWIQELIDDLDALISSSLKQLRNALPPNEKDVLQAANVACIRGLVKLSSGLPKASEFVPRALKNARERLVRLTHNHPAFTYRESATIEQTNTYTQPSVPLAFRTISKPIFPLAWVELQFVYSDNLTPVKDARYQLTEDGPDLGGKLDIFGFAYCLVKRDRQCVFEFSDDPNPYVLAEGAKCKAKSLDIVLDLPGIINSGCFLAPEALYWGDTLFTNEDDFKGVARISKLAHCLAHNNSPYHPNVETLEDLTRALYPLVMGSLLESADRKKLWKDTAFLALACQHEIGPLVRDLLTSIESGEAKSLAIAVQMLNSKGIGNALAWLSELKAKLDLLQDGAVDEITKILTTLKQWLNTIGGGPDDKVSAAVKSMLRAVVKEIDAVLPSVKAELQEALAPARERLVAVCKEQGPQYGGKATLFTLNRIKQDQQDLPVRARPNIPPLDWTALEYRHNNDDLLGAAEYVIKKRPGGDLLREGALDAGCAFIVLPLNQEFEFVFRREAAFQLDAVQLAPANADVKLPDLARRALLSNKLKRAQIDWGASALIDRLAFVRQPSIGQLAANVIRAKTAYAAAGRNAIRELAELLQHLLFRTKDNSVLGKANDPNYRDNSDLWAAVVLNRFAARTADGTIVSDLLARIHSECPRDAARVIQSSPTKQAVIAYLNSIGRGNAVKWLETCAANYLTGVVEGDIVTNLNDLLTDLTAELNALKANPKPKRRLLSRSAEAYADMVLDRIAAITPGIAGSVAQVFNELKEELAAILAKPLQPYQGVRQQLNQVKQPLTPLVPRPAFVPPDWIELQYNYPNGSPVIESGGNKAKYKIRTPGGIAEIITGDLDRWGHVYLSDVPANVEFVFRDDPQVYKVRQPIGPNVLKWSPDGRPGYTSTDQRESATHGLLAGAGQGNAGRVPLVAVTPTQTGPNIYAAFTLAAPFQWEPSSLTTAYRDQPTLGKLARISVARFTDRSCYARSYTCPDHESEVRAGAPGACTKRVPQPGGPAHITVPCAKPLVLKDTPYFYTCKNHLALRKSVPGTCTVDTGGAVLCGLALVVAPVAKGTGLVYEQDEMVECLRRILAGLPGVDLLAWSVATMNRVGAMNVPGLVDEQSRLRKAVLLELQANPAITLDTLVALLNSVGRGHAPDWLRQLYAHRAAIKTAIVNSIRSALNGFDAECVAVNTKAGLPAAGAGGAVVQGVIGTVRGQIATVVAHNYIEGHVDTILDPIFARIDALLPTPLPADPLRWRFVTAANLNQMNRFNQPVRHFGLCELLPVTPPDWAHAAATNVDVKYESRTAADVTAHYSVQQGANAAVVRAGVNGRQTFVVNAGAGSVMYEFDKDVGVFAPDADAQPWQNPLRNLLPNTYLQDAILADAFATKNDIPWDDSAVTSAVGFRANPTIGKLLTQAVITAMPNVSTATDSEDASAALASLVRKVHTRTHADTWFRAAAILLGSVPTHGSLLRGLLVRVHTARIADGAELVSLLNLVGEGNAVGWVKTYITTDANMSNVAATMTAILTDFKSKLDAIITSTEPDTRVSAALKLNLTPVSTAVNDVLGLVNANVPACFTSAKTTLANLIGPGGGLPMRHYAGIMLNVYRREKAPSFIEIQQGLPAADKDVADRLATAAIAAANQRPGNPLLATGVGAPPHDGLFQYPPLTPDPKWQALGEYLAVPQTRGMQARSIAPQLAQMSKAEFVDFLEQLGPPWVKTDAKWSQGAMLCYEHPDGTLIRYKPHGDAFQRPPAATYSIEVTKAGAGVPSALGDQAFKVDPNGNAVPWGPDPANMKPPPRPIPGLSTAASQQGAEAEYAQVMARAGHRTLNF